MEGLDLIKERILNKAKSKAQIILEQADAYVAEQMAEALEKRESMLDSARKKADQDAKALFLQTESIAETEKRKLYLAERQEQITEIIDLAIANLLSLPSQEKVKLYSSLLESRKIQQGEIILNQQDQAIKTELLEALGENFTLASEIAKIKGGFLLRQGLVVDNFSYDLVLRNSKAKLTADLAGLLEDEAKL